MACSTLGGMGIVHHAAAAVRALNPALFTNGPDGNQAAEKLPHS